MADLYKVVYAAKDSQPQKQAFVSATSVANAIAAVKTADSRHMIDTQHVTVFVVHPNIIIGS
jgi:hypothetical protein